MRGFLIVLAACGAGASTAPPASGPRVEDAAPARTMQQPAAGGMPADPISALSVSRVETGWSVPGPAQLALGGPSLQPVNEEPLEVDLIEERGSEVRVGVRLDHVRFAVWTARSRLLSVLKREQHVSASPAAEFVGDGAPRVALRTGARVTRLAHKKGFTQVRYIGSLEVEGWVPDEALGDRGPTGHASGRRIARHKSLMVVRGTAIRTDKRATARALAVAYFSTFVDLRDTLDEGWHLVSYDDNDVSALGYLSKRLPPASIHRRAEPEPAVTVTANVTVPTNTCLYAGAEAVGFVVGDRPALVEKSQRVGWFTLTLDTPWGPVDFEASGPAETALTTCGGATP